MENKKMKTWNVYKSVNGINEIIKTVESNQKPKIKHGEIAILKPCNKTTLPEYNPFLAFPDAYNKD
jgi:hypothetical protein